MTPAILFLVGPTGCGKSDLGIRLAKKLNGEIVSCDSMLVYRGMNIGTAKVPVKARQGIRHHLMDLITPKQKFSVADYRRETLRVIADIIKRGKIPIVVGGSGLYLRALVDGIADQPVNTAKFRKKLERDAVRHGLSYLYQRLKRVDPVRAKEILPTDARRIIRALEIYDALKLKPSAWQKTAQGLDALGYAYQLVGLVRDRAELYERINQRVDSMMASGFVREVRRLKRAGFSLTSRQAIGYSEVLKYLSGEMTYEDVVAMIKQRSRNLAKKQLTWFRREKRIRWISVSGNSHLTEGLRQIAEEWKAGSVPWKK